MPARCRWRWRRATKSRWDWTGSRSGSQGYKQQGARFAKWRAVYNVSDTLPSRAAIEANAEALARYAAICQAQGVVPIVEPEVLIDGDHTMARCAEVTQDVLHEVFDALHRHHVALEHMLLKPSMVVPGKAHAQQATPATWRRDPSRAAPHGAARRCRASIFCPVASRLPRRRPTSTR